MGTWSHQPFSNDNVHDWAWDLYVATDLNHVEAALDEVLEVGVGRLSNVLAQRAIGALEVMAKLLGRGTQKDSDTQDIDAWVASMDICPTQDLLNKAQAVIKRIMADDSELAEQWLAHESYRDWQQSMQPLAERLISPNR